MSFSLLVSPLLRPYVYPSSLSVLRADAQLPGASPQKVGWYTQSGRKAGALAVRRRYQLLGALTAMIECHLFRQSCRGNEYLLPRAASENAIPVYRCDARSAHFVVSSLHHHYHETRDARSTLKTTKIDSYVDKEEEKFVSLVRCASSRSCRLELFDDGPTEPPRAQSISVARPCEAVTPQTWFLPPCGTTRNLKHAKRRREK